MKQDEIFSLELSGMKMYLMGTVLFLMTNACFILFSFPVQPLAMDLPVGVLYFYGAILFAYTSHKKVKNQHKRRMGEVMFYCTLLLWFAIVACGLFHLPFLFWQVNRLPTYISHNAAMVFAIFFYGRLLNSENSILRHLVKSVLNGG